MRMILADLRGRGGIVTKDTVVGGYGSRLTPFSKVTRIVGRFKHRFHDVPSVTMGYLGALLAADRHEVRSTRGSLVDGDVAVVLSSLVDYRHETSWARRMRERGVRVGFVGLAASKLPELFLPHADFVVTGEPEEAIRRLSRGERLAGVCPSEPVPDLDALPFPRWDLVTDRPSHAVGVPFSGRPLGGGFPLLASRSCPEFCTYCPHRVLAPYRTRSVANVVDEVEQLSDRYHKPYVIFRDPLFTQDRERCEELCQEIRRRRLRLRFECETRLDRLDPALIDVLYAAGLRTVSFGVESVSAATLKRVGRRPTPEAHQRTIVEHCHRRGIVTAAFYVLGFLDDDRDSIAATIDYAADLGSTFAQFKLLTPYPATPLWKKMAPLVTEQDWERFDGYTPVFSHPHLSGAELRLLLGAAYTRFYMRPSYPARYLRVRNRRVLDVLTHLDHRVAQRQERALMDMMSAAC
jgi:radical SAM superfamily enzyme YgiQ (UPF0313 family)